MPTLVHSVICPNCVRKISLVIEMNGLSHEQLVFCANRKNDDGSSISGCNKWFAVFIKLQPITRITKLSDNPPTGGEKEEG